MGEKDETKNQVETKGAEGGGDKAKAAAVDGGVQAEKGPITVVLKMELHCEGCAKKVKRSIGYLPGVKKVKAECDAKKLTVIGNNIDPSWIREKVEQKTKKKVELISPQPKKATDDDKSEKIKAGDDRKSDKDTDKKPKEPVVSTVMMKIRLHCAGCANKIKRIILKNIDGVNLVTTNLEKDLVTVMGTMDVEELLSYLKDKLKRGVDIVPPPKRAEEGGGGDKKEKENNENKKDKDEKKESGGGDDKKDNESKPKAENAEEKKKDEGDSESKPKDDSNDGASKKNDETRAEMINNKMENLSFNPHTYYAVPMHYQNYGNYNHQDYGIHPMMYQNNQGYYPNTNYMVRYPQGPPPPSPTYVSNTNDNMFSDENPNGCFVM